MEWLMLMWIWPKLYSDDKKKSERKSSGKEIHNVYSEIIAIQLTMIIMCVLSIVLMSIMLIQIVRALY